MPVIILRILSYEELLTYIEHVLDTNGDTKSVLEFVLNEVLMPVRAHPIALEEELDEALKYKDQVTTLEGENTELLHRLSRVKFAARQYADKIQQLTTQLTKDIEED